MNNDKSINMKTAVLLLRENPNQAPDPYRMEELKGLAAAAGYRVLAEITQRRGRDHRFQLGRGKIQEAMSYSPGTLIFYNPLSPARCSISGASSRPQPLTGLTLSSRSSYPVHPLARLSCK